VPAPSGLPEGPRQVAPVPTRLDDQSLRKDREDLEEPHRRVLEVHADLEREALEARPHGHAGTSTEAVRAPSWIGASKATVMAAPRGRPRPPGAGNRMARGPSRSQAPVAVGAVANGQEAGLSGRDAPVGPARGCSFVHASIGEASTRERRDAGV